MPGWLRADNPRAAARVAQAIRVLLRQFVSGS
jgi:hypothetical protein